MTKWRYLLKVSRYRFWLYLAGTYLVGTAFAILTPNTFLQVEFILFFLFFTFPANLFLYGVNDLADEETDRLNKKKTDKEVSLQRGHEQSLKFWISLALAGFTLLSFIFLDSIGQVMAFLFVLLSWQYSAEPFRFKGIPILDFSSNILYGIPGFIAYYQFHGQLPSLTVVLAVFCWTGAMHLFSAIPDIVPDTKAGIKTTAVWLGREKSLMLCVFLWGVTAILSYDLLGWFGVVAFVYPVVAISLLFRKSIAINNVYWLFPYINAVLGAWLFFIGVFSLL